MNDMLHKVLGLPFRAPKAISPWTLLHISNQTRTSSTPDYLGPIVLMRVEGELLVWIGAVALFVDMGFHASRLAMDGCSGEAQEGRLGSLDHTRTVAEIDIHAHMGLIINPTRPTRLWQQIPARLAGGS